MIININQYLEFHVFEWNWRAVHDLVLGERNVLNRLSRAHLIEVQCVRLVDEYSDMLRSLVGRTSDGDRMQSDRLAGG